MSKAMTPNEINSLKQELIPEFVFDAFNKLIAKNLNGKTSFVKVKDVVENIVLANDVTAQKIYDSKWLDIEQSYRDAGWFVIYDSPAYNETYDSYFRFTIK